MKVQPAAGLGQALFRQPQLDYETFQAFWGLWKWLLIWAPFWARIS